MPEGYGIALANTTAGLKIVRVTSPVYNWYGRPDEPGPSSVEIVGYH